ncbi:hypothetical protein, partial [Burkholderia plantarii]|uniref:hypothetical protein n=1 Tax=Burkholderia plantarii TaxID=41899 RepID=UPI002552FFFB
VQQPSACNALRSSTSSSNALLERRQITKLLATAPRNPAMNLFYLRVIRAWRPRPPIGGGQFHSNWRAGGV